MKSLAFTINRKILRQQPFVCDQLIPFLKTCHPQTLRWITASSQPLRPYFTASAASTSNPTALPPILTTSVRALVRDGLRSGDIRGGLAAVAWVEQLQRRIVSLPTKNLVHSQYQFDVGDVLVHKYLGHVGVVAARLPTCFESDQWITEHLGSVDDCRMRAPWYLMLIGRHRNLPPDFSRYGSELTHVRVPEPTSIGMNRYLPLYFQGFDSQAGIYIKRTSELGFSLPSLKFGPSLPQIDDLLQGEPRQDLKAFRD